MSAAGVVRPRSRGVHRRQEMTLKQRKRLEEAFDSAGSKKKLQVKQLVGDTQLSREEVLAYLNWWSSLDADVRADLQSTRLEAERAAEERRMIEMEQRKLAAAEATARNRTFQEIKDIKRAKQKDKISKAALAVLEKVFAQGERYPSSSLIAELSAVNKLRRKDVVRWFERRRKEQKEDFGVVGPHQ